MHKCFICAEAKFICLWPFCFWCHILAKSKIVKICSCFLLRLSELKLLCLGLLPKLSYVLFGVGMVQLHSSVAGYPVSPIPFVEKTVLSPLNGLGVVSKLLWPHVGCLFLCSVLQCAVCLSFTPVCLVSCGPFSSDDRWLCARPVLCLGQSDNT